MLTTKKITANSSFFLTALVFQKILSFIYFTILARNIGAEATGQYFFAISFATMFAVLMDFGLSPVLIREVAKDEHDEKLWFQQIFTLKLLFTLLAVIFLLILNWTVFAGDAVQPLIYLTTLIVVIDSFSLLFYAFTRGQQNLKFESIGTIVFQLIVMIFGLGLLHYSHNLVLLIAVLGLASFFNLLYSGFILYYKFSVKVNLVFSSELVKRIFWITIPFALAAIFAKVYAYIDSVLLKLFLGDAEVGLYSVAYKITFAFQFIPLALVAALYPAFAHLFKHDQSELRKVFAKAFNYLGFIALPLSFGIMALAPEIIHQVYTTEFAWSVLPLQILISSLVFLFINFSLSSLLNATNRQAINTKNLGLVMVINVILNIILIQTTGIIGAALASSISTVVLFGLNLAYAWPVAQAKLGDLQPLLFSLIFSVIMWLVVIYLKTMIWWPLTIVIGGIVYIVLMFVFRVITIKELKFLKSSMFNRQA